MFVCVISFMLLAFAPADSFLRRCFLTRVRVRAQHIFIVSVNCLDLLVIMDGSVNICSAPLIDCDRTVAS